MSISLKDSMKLGKFNECEVVAGHEGMDRMVENITIMEVPDIVQWLKRKELILTSLYAIKDDLDAQNVLIQRLYYAGATALAIKPFESMNDIPQAIINSANRLGFPVIHIPNHVKYLDVLSPVMHHIFNEKVVLQEDIEQATNVLHEIALNSQGLDAFAENVSSITRNVVTIESEWDFIQTPVPLQPISPLTADEKHELSILKRPITYKRKYNQDVVKCIVAPIIVDRQYYGNITCWEVDHQHISMDIAVLEQASSLISLEFLRLKVKHDLEQQYRSDFMRELLFNENIKEDDLIEWGEKYNTTKDKDYVCILMSVAKHSEQHVNLTDIKDAITGMIQKQSPSFLIGIVRGNICIIYPNDSSEQMQQIIEDIYQRAVLLLNQVMSPYIGVGGTYQGIKGIRKSFSQAEQAVKLSKMSQTMNKISYYNELGAYRLLEPLKDTQELIDFYENSIERLIKEDIKKELIHTLQTYFYEDEVLKVTAERLYIHVNTLKYRMKRIEEITGLQFKKSEDKLTLFLGLKIYELMYKI